MCMIRTTVRVASCSRRSGAYVGLVRRAYDPFAFGRSLGGFPLEAPPRRVRREPHRVPVDRMAEEAVPPAPEIVADAPTAEPEPSAAEEIERVKERLERDGEREVTRRTHAVLTSLLDVIDDLDRALAGAEALGGADRALMDGVEMVRKRFLDKLAAHGVQRATAIGDPFDPEQHEALATAPVDHPDHEGTVVAVVRPGYRVDGELLRPAGVVVGTL